MSNPTAPIHTDEKGTQTHPAFATATVTRISSFPGAALFQSDLRHDHYVRLTVRTATRDRSGGQDSIYPQTNVVTINLSETQWGQLVSSVGQGSGVPVTLSQVGTESVPDLPYEPRTAKSREDVASSVADLLATITEKFAVLSEAIEQKKGVKAIRAALHDLRYAIENAPANARHAVVSLERAAEAVVADAVGQIEAAAQRSAGSASLVESSTDAVRALEAGTE